MAKGSCLTRIRATLNAARLDLTSGAFFRISVLSPTSVMLVAKPPAHGAVIAVINRALHWENVQMGCDTSSRKWASPSTIN